MSDQLPTQMCPCACHGGLHTPCDQPGGCGSLHRQPDTMARPAWACQLHRPPKRVGAWVRADDNYRTCSSCLDRLREIVRDLAAQWLLLDARPGGGAEHGSRGAPGFGSRSPANDDVIVMRDRRSKSCEGIDEWFEPIQIPHNTFGHDARTNPLLADIDRPHTEQAKPHRSVPGVLSGLAGLIAEERGIEPPSGDVYALVRWLDNQLDYVTRQDWVRDFADDIRALRRQLKPVTGEPGRKRIGSCPNTIDDGEQSRECGANLYAPLRGDEIECNACGRTWPRPDWEKLGQLLQSGIVA